MQNINFYKSLIIKIFYIIDIYDFEHHFSDDRNFNKE
jgi:hypothetical protein